jgi:hypothetical protein
VEEQTVQHHLDSLNMGIRVVEEQAGRRAEELVVVVVVPGVLVRGLTVTLRDLVVLV